MLLLIPGPVQTRPEVKAAMAQDIAPWDRDFQKVYARIRERIVGVAGHLSTTRMEQVDQALQRFGRRSDCRC